MNRKEKIGFIAIEVLAVLGVPLIIWAVTDGAWTGTSGTSVLIRSYHGRTITPMSTVVKRSISLPADVFEALEAQAAEEGRTVSAALADAADLWLATRRGLRAVRAWEREHGALTAEELAAADRELDRAGVGRV